MLGLPGETPAEDIKVVLVSESEGEESESVSDAETVNTGSGNIPAPKLTLKERWENFIKVLLSRSTLYILIFIAGSTATTVIYKKVSILYPSYPYLLAQVPCVFSFTIYALMLSLRYCFRYLRGYYSEQSTSPDEDVLINHPPKKPKSYSYTRQSIMLYAFLGFILAIFLLFSRLGNRGDGVSPSLSVLLGQFNIPIVMCISIIFLRVRYSLIQYVGVVIIIGGIVLSVAESLAHSHGALLNVIFVIISQLPQACSSVTMDYYLKKRRISLMVLWLGIFWFQFWFGIPLAFAILPLEDVSIPDAPQHLIDGLQCLFLQKYTEGKPDDCDAVIYWFLAQLFLGVGFIFVFSKLLHLESATLVVLGSACVIPLANVVFALHFVMGKDAQPLVWYDIVAIVLVTTGLIVYKLGKERRPPPVKPSEMTDRKELKTVSLRTESTEASINS